MKSQRFSQLNPGSNRIISYHRRVRLGDFWGIEKKIIVGQRKQYCIVSRGKLWFIIIRWSFFCQRAKMEYSSWEQILFFPHYIYYNQLSELASFSLTLLLFLSSWVKSLYMSNMRTRTNKRTPVEENFAFLYMLICKSCFFSWQITTRTWWRWTGQ